MRKEIYELSESLSLPKDLAEELLVATESSSADVLALGVELDSRKESLAARDDELERLRVTVGVK